MWSAWVTDEELDRVALPAALAVKLWKSVGSVPPPLAAYQPAAPPIVYPL
jgi:hypothetical protein